MRTRLIVDSTFDLLPHMKDKVQVVHLTVRFGEEEFIDGVNIDHEMFYDKLVNGKDLPKTSQATPGDFDEIYQTIDEKEEAAIVLTLSSKLSGTYQSAVIAAQSYKNIHVIDCGNVTIGGSVLVDYALRLIEEGKATEEIVAELEDKKQRIVLVALVDTLEYLYKGGRLSRTVAIAGTILNIKPVLSVIDGDIHVLGKARGIKLGNNLLSKQIENVGGIDFEMPIILGYSGLSDELLKKYIEDCGPMWKDHTESLRYTSIGTVIGTHAGPGAIAVAFFKKGA